MGEKAVAHRAAAPDSSPARCAIMSVLEFRATGSNRSTNELRKNMTRDDHVRCPIEGCALELVAELEEPFESPKDLKTRLCTDVDIRDCEEIRDAGLTD